MRRTISSPPPFVPLPPLSPERRKELLSGFEESYSCLSLQKDTSPEISQQHLIRRIDLLIQSFSSRRVELEECMDRFSLEIALEMDQDNKSCPYLLRDKFAQMGIVPYPYDNPLDFPSLSHYEAGNQSRGLLFLRISGKGWSLNPDQIAALAEDVTPDYEVHVASLERGPMVRHECLTGVRAVLQHLRQNTSECERQQYQNHWEEEKKRLLGMSIKPEFREVLVAR